MTRTVVFAREQLRAPFTLALLVAVPALFVVSAAGVLSDFASALGGSLAGDAAVALSAGWAAAFISGALGFFQAASSRRADRRLALAGLGPARVASSRIAASVGLAVVAAAAAFVALVVRVDVAHPLHAAVAVLALRCCTWRSGSWSVAHHRAAGGSLLVVFVFLLDAFAGPGMTGGSAPPWAISQKAADVLIAAGLGTGSPTGDWVSSSSSPSARSWPPSSSSSRPRGAGHERARGHRHRLGFEQSTPSAAAGAAGRAAVLLHHARSRARCSARLIGCPAAARCCDDEGRPRRLDGPITVAFLAPLRRLHHALARGADRRLVVAGFRPHRAVVPRLAVLAAPPFVVLGSRWRSR